MPIPFSVVPFNNDEHCVSRRGYRPRMKSEYLKCPYIIRAVDIIKGVPRQETRVVEWIFSLQGEPNDIVFHTLDEFSAQRFHMESFFPTCELFGHVNDCWSQVLNLDKKSQRKDKFIENLVLSIEDMDASLCFVGLLFLPIIRSFNIFLFVINLQHPEFVIIDKNKVDDPDGERYAGFKNESSAQDDQLVKLRTKYLYKIITHEYNVKKDYVLQKVDEFHTIPSRQRSQLLAIAKEEIHRRLDDLS
ncbi:unnamed protein product [Lactuca saligna]|uniref:Uncharacterized protein n=1 Tax=Lactuca saligna TaxID=75948 RepID=A0AA35ZJP1_LACSI|nr:unnamed protein product [Lactuca saligna]CAI9293448.1 unnamed protein product [Lactuca saligna]